MFFFHGIIIINALFFIQLDNEMTLHNLLQLAKSSKNTTLLLLFFPLVLLHIFVFSFVLQGKKNLWTFCLLCQNKNKYKLLVTDVSWRSAFGLRESRCHFKVTAPTVQGGGGKILGTHWLLPVSGNWGMWQRLRPLPPLPSLAWLLKSHSPTHFMYSLRIAGCLV